MARKTLLEAVTVTGAGETVSSSLRPLRAFAATVIGDGAVSADVSVEGSMDGANWAVLHAFELSGTDAAYAIQTINSPVPHLRGNVTEITGTDAAVSMSVAT